MKNTERSQTLDRHTSFGLHGLKPLESLGVWLSHRAINQIVKKYDRPRLLDLGSGYSCRLINYFNAVRGSSTAVDIQLDPALRQVADLMLIESTIEESWPKLQTEHFDIVTMINVLEHVWAPQAILQEAASRLRPGGSLIINVPTWLGKKAHEFQAFRLGLSSAIEIDDHKMYYDKEDLWPMLIRSGFKPSRIKQYYHKFRLNLFSVSKKIT